MRFEVTNRGTRYVIYRVDARVDDQNVQFLLLETRFANSGEWIRLLEDSVAWSYLAEKLPGIEHYEGDKEGWIMVFAKAGVEVFG